MAQQLVARDASDGKALALLIRRDGRTGLVARLAVDRPDIEASRRKLALHSPQQKVRSTRLDISRRQDGADRRKLRRIGGRVNRCGCNLSRPRRACDRNAMKVLQIKRVVNDASREPAQGQEYEPRR